LNLGFDFDGVLANSHPLKAVVAKEKFGVDIPPELFRRERVIAQGLLTREQYFDVGIEAMGGKHEIPPVEKAIPYMKSLMEIHSVRIVTSRTGGMLDVASSWLYGHGITDVNIQGTGYGLSKTSACEGLDLYVDDDLEKLLPLIGIVPHLLFFSWPWNMHEKDSQVIRVVSWREILEYIERIKS